MSRGDIYLADLNPSRGSEQAGIRPVVIVQRETIDRFTQTVVIVPGMFKPPSLEHSWHFYHSRRRRWTHSRISGSLLSNCSHR